MGTTFTHFSYVTIPHQDVSLILALEEWATKDSSLNTILLWQTPPSVILGKYQDVLLETDPSYLQQHGVGLYRRFTGGGTVYTDLGNINISFIGAQDAFSFRQTAQEMIAFLDTLDVVAEADARHSLFIGHQKISGAAQSIYKQRKIYHATLLVSTDPQRLKSAITPSNIAAPSDRKSAVTSHYSPVTNIYGNAGQGFSPQQVVKLWESFLRDEGVSKMEYSTLLSKINQEKVSTLQNERYNNPLWTMQGVNYKTRI